MKEKLLRVSRGLLGASAFIAAAGLIYETALIYLNKESGVQPYTYAVISAAFEKIALPIWIFIFFTAVMLVISAFIPQKRGIKPDENTRYEFSMMRTDAPETAEFKKELSVQKRASGISAAVCVLCIAAMAVFTFSNGFFASNDLEKEMGHYMPVFAVLTFISLCAVFTAHTVIGRSRKKCLELIKGAPRHAVSMPEANKNAVLAARLIILTAAGAFITLGIINGGLYDVFVKAINICTECIGLG